MSRELFPLDDIIKGISLICTWWNTRYQLAPPTQMQFEDWVLVSFDQGEGGNWSMTVLHRNIADHYFMAVHNAETGDTELKQYKLIEQDTINDADLKVDNTDAPGLRNAPDSRSKHFLPQLPRSGGTVQRGR